MPVRDRVGRVTSITADPAPNRSPVVVPQLHTMAEDVTSLLD
jgi:hypothetical protein